MSRLSRVAREAAKALGPDSRYRYIPSSELTEMKAAHESRNVETRDRLRRRWARRREFSEARVCYRGPWSPRSSLLDRRGGEEIVVVFGEEPADGCTCMSRTLDALDDCPAFGERVAGAVLGHAAQLGFVAGELHRGSAFDVAAWAEQRAALALDLLPALEAEAKERQLSGLQHVGDSLVSPETDERGRADAKAAELVGVGRSTVAHTKCGEGSSADDPSLQTVRDMHISHSVGLSASAGVVSPRAWRSQRSRADDFPSVLSIWPDGGF